MIKKIMAIIIGFLFLQSVATLRQSSISDALKDLQKDIVKYAQDERETGDYSFARELDSQAAVLQNYVERFSRGFEQPGTFDAEVAAVKAYLDALTNKISDRAGVRKAVEQLTILKPYEIRGLKAYMKIDNLRKDL